MRELFHGYHIASMDSSSRIRHVKMITCFICCFFFNLAHADKWLVGTGVAFSSIEDKALGTVDLNTVPIILGYQIETDKNVTFTPELRYGFGVGDDKYDQLTVEIDKMLTLGIRAQWEVNDKIFIFFAPAKVKLTARAAGSGVQNTGTESGLGIGFGGGMQITNDLSAEINYESYDLNGADFDLLGIAFRKTF